MEKARLVLIGIAGGSGSGKSYLARHVRSKVGKDKVAILSVDQYFKAVETTNPHDVNYDHPAHIDVALLLEHLNALKAGESIKAPSYDFRQQTRRLSAIPVGGVDVVLVEGLFVLASPICELLDLSIFLDVQADQRLIGRILRDLKERTPEIEWIIDRYQRFVRPSYQAFVEPTKQNADIVVDFTYRRKLFQELFANMVRQLTEPNVDRLSFIKEFQNDEYKLGFKASESVAKTALDLLTISELLPESASPRESDASPKLYEADNAPSGEG